MKKTVALSLILIVVIALILPVQVSAAKQVTWNVPGDFATIQEAIDSPSVKSGEVILVSPGSHSGALVNKSVQIKGLGGAVIDSGPAHGSGMIMGFRLLEGSDGTVISHLQFKVDLAIMNGGAVNNITVDHCTFLDSVQAVSNWRGSGWEIGHNDIVNLKTRNGGGIGILIGDFTGGTVGNNVISFNNISGTLYAGGWYEDPSAEKGGYNGSGIVLYADFRWGSAGALQINNNKVTHNKVSMVSDTPNVVDIAAFEMTDSRDDVAAVPYPVIFDNSIGFNDFRGTVLQIVLTPENLSEYNSISRNLGENRCHGLHPRVIFK